ncbi:hypothetical protein D3C84_1104300 [compost metagenome]
MHLPNGGSCDRRLVEGGIQLVYRRTELGFQNGGRFLERNRRYVVLQLHKLGDNVGWQQIGPRAGDLANFNKGGAKLL